MKKLLALVLALVMTLSLATVSTSAAFEDAADISYEEAAGVLSAVGVFVGDGKNFNPKAALNREQAAKLVAYLALGEDVAEALPAVAMFDDVAVSSWSAKYVAYCADAGIITGDGAGKFFPASPVTGYAFAKMVMCALGYEAEAEGFTGGNWEINVAKLAKKLGLPDGGLKLEANLTREQAAQLMLNAIKCQEVTGYNNVGSSVTIGNVVVNQSWGDAQDNGGVYYENKWDTLYFYPASTTDAFGREANEWVYTEEDWSGVYATDTADFVITEKMTAKEMAALLKGYKLGEYKVNNDTTVVSATVEGVTMSNETVANALAELTKDGKVVEIFAGTDKVINQIVTMSYYFDEVLDIDVDEKTGDVTYDFKNTATYTNTEDATPVVFAGELAEDDYVTVFAGKDGKAYVYPTTKFVGALTSYTQDGVYTIGGDTYTTSEAYADDALTIGDAATYYLDQYGFVVATDAIATASSNYAYVLGVLGKSATGFDGTVPAAQVKVLLTDGTVGVYDLKIAKKSGNYYVVDADGAPVDANEIQRADGTDNANGDFGWLLNKTFTYVLSGNTIALKATTAACEANKVFVASMYYNSYDTEYVAKNDAQLDVVYNNNADAVVAAYMNDKTTYIFWDGDEVDAVVVGNTKLGDKQFCYNVNTDVVVSYNEAGTKATVKYVFVMGGFKAVAETVDTYGYIDSDEYTVSENEDEETVYTYDMVLVDGTSIKVTAESPYLTNDGLYKYNSDKTVANNTILPERYVVGSAEVNGSVIKIGDGFYNMTADTKVVNVSDNYETDDDAYLAMAYTDKDGKVLVSLYIVDALA